MDSLRPDLMIKLTYHLAFTDSVNLSSINKTYYQTISNCPKCIKRKLKIQKTIINSCMYHIKKKILLYHYELPQTIRSSLIKKETCYTSIDKDLEPYIDGWNLDILEYAQERVRDLTGVSHNGKTRNAIEKQRWNPWHELKRLSSNSGYSQN
mgnify:CR=1 FL=1